MLGSQVGEVVSTARRLGLDHALRGVKVRPVYVGRKAKLKTRLGLLKKLRGSGRPGRSKVFQAGMLPSLFVGAEIHTPPCKDLMEAKKLVVTTQGLKQPGVPYQLGLATLPPQADPLGKVLEKVLGRWHREVWYAIAPIWQPP